MRRARMTYGVTPGVADLVEHAAAAMDRSQSWVVERAVKDWLDRRAAEGSAVTADPVARVPVTELVERLRRVEVGTFAAVPQARDEITRADAAMALRTVE